MHRACSVLRLLQTRGVQGYFSCVVEMVLQGAGCAYRFSASIRVGSGVCRQAGVVRRSDRTVDLGLCCSTNELQAKLVALVTQTAQASPTLVPVVTQNKTPAMPANQGAAPAAKSNLERAVGILKGLHWDVDMHAEL